MDTQLKEPPTKIQLKSPWFLSHRIRKRYYKILGTSVINLSMSAPSLSKGQLEIYILLLKAEFHNVRLILALVDLSL